jgi:hypothetical protein
LRVQPPALLRNNRFAVVESFGIESASPINLERSVTLNPKP